MPDLRLVRPGPVLCDWCSEPAPDDRVEPMPHPEHALAPIVLYVGDCCLLLVASKVRLGAEAWGIAYDRAAIERAAEAVAAWGERLVERDRRAREELKREQARIRGEPVLPAADPWTDLGGEGGGA